MAAKHIKGSSPLSAIWETQIKEHCGTITDLLDWEKSKAKTKINRSI